MTLLGRKGSYRYLLLLVALLVLAGAGGSSSAVAETQAPVQSGKLFLPVVSRSYWLSYRLGFGSLDGLDKYKDVASLRAGWYVNWTVEQAPDRPLGMEYVQTVRVHQKLTCPIASTYAHDRTRCPYAKPYSYVIAPDWPQIQSAARANRGSLWMVGNEMDRRDWPGGGHQDETLPETYAVAYHDIYLAIKQADPTAQVAIGGVIQATPLRLEYMTKVWNEYARQYGRMPVDVWNVHNFILKEDLYDFGASVPPGSTATRGVWYGNDYYSHVDMTIFHSQLLEFRKWMAARGEQNKPLIVSEYGILFPGVPALDTPSKVAGWMEGTFDYFLNTRDCSIGYAKDGCRLVQRWAWYSLDDKYSEFNEYGALLDPRTGFLTETGARFRQYSLTHLIQLQR